MPSNFDILDALVLSTVFLQILMQDLLVVMGPLMQYRAGLYRVIGKMCWGGIYVMIQRLAKSELVCGITSLNICLNIPNL